MARVFILDSDVRTLRALGELLQRKGNEVGLFTAISPLLQRLLDHPDVVVCAGAVQGVDAWSLGRAVLARVPGACVLLLTETERVVTHPAESRQAVAHDPVPCSRADLVSVLDSVLGARSPQAPAAGPSGGTRTPLPRR